MPSSDKRGRSAVPSRQWSCSELAEGHGALVKAKQEHESDEELQEEIKDCKC